MISAGDILHILSEIHQYSLLLIELKDATTLGISHLAEGKLACFVINKPLKTLERTKVVKEIYEGKASPAVKPLPMEEFLNLIEGSRVRHIWLEAGDAERSELGFLSIAELKTHFRTHSKR
jgi:hypothetical protein